MQDKKIFNWVLFIGLIVSPVLGVILLDAPEGVDGSDALFFTAAIGWGWGIFITGLFAILWAIKRFFVK